jgi:hypothetical protein
MRFTRWTTVTTEKEAVVRPPNRVFQPQQARMFIWVDRLETFDRRTGIRPEIIASYWLNILGLKKTKYTVGTIVDAVSLRKREMNMSFGHVIRKVLGRIFDLFDTA